MAANRDQEGVKDGDCIQVTLKVENEIVEPLFNISITLRDRQRQLIYFLQEAANLNKEFQFSADFYSGGLGYFITSINKQKSDSEHFWKMYGREGSLQVGVSTYIPQDEETVTFKLTKLSGASSCN